MQSRLTKRQQQVLWATIKHYIETAEPVGSRALAQEYPLHISPATIRGVMGALEKVGLLYQPHTSAGRIPSDSGYRLYVDELITPSTRLTDQVEQVLIDRLQTVQWSFENLLRYAAQVLATLSGCVALITVPQSSTTIRHVQFVKVAAQRVMIIVVTDIYEIQSVLMNLPQQPDTGTSAEEVDTELQILSNFLNHHLHGQPISNLASLDWKDLDRQFQHYAEGLNTLLKELAQRSCALQTRQIFVWGISRSSSTARVFRTASSPNHHPFTRRRSGSASPPNLGTRQSSWAQIRVGKRQATSLYSDRAGKPFRANPGLYTCFLCIPKRRNPHRQRWRFRSHPYGL